MSRAGPLLALLWLGIATSAAGGKAEPPAPPRPPEPGVTRTAFDGGERIDAVLDGRLVGYALPRDAGGTRRVFLVVRAPRGIELEEEEEEQPEKAPGASANADPGDVPSGDTGPCAGESPAPASLWRLDLPEAGSAEPRLVLVRDDLPGSVSGADARDVNGDGQDELLLFLPGEVRVLDEADGRIGAGELGLLLEDPELRWESLGSSPFVSGNERERAWLQVSGVRETRYYGADPETGAWRRVAAVELPVQASHWRHGLTVRSASPAALGAAGDAAPVFGALSARPFDMQRLQVYVIRPAAEAPAARFEDCWARLPGREILMHQSIHLLDGEPVLLVTTMPAERMSLFGEQELRLFALEADRSRVGLPPRAAFRTRANNIKPVSPFLFDLDGDGRQDLVLGRFKGFDDEAVVLDVYLRREDGSFPEEPRSTEIGVKKADASVLHYGQDLSGDGIPDLLLVAGDQLRVHRGTPGARQGKNVVDPRPGLTAPLDTAVYPKAVKKAELGPEGGREYFEAAAPRPRPVDLDRTGHLEILLTRRDLKGRSVFTVYRFGDRDPHAPRDQRGE